MMGRAVGSPFSVPMKEVKQEKTIRMEHCHTMGMRIPAGRMAGAASGAIDW